jgi:DNA-binding PadR family transcriptional regulator
MEPSAGRRLSGAVNLIPTGFGWWRCDDAFPKAGRDREPVLAGDLLKKSHRLLLPATTLRDIIYFVINKDEGPMPQEIQGDQLRGHLEAMILSVLEQQEAHGFQIVKRLEEMGCGLLRLKEGTVYPVLYRLEQSRLVKARWEPAEEGRRGPPRRIYQLTRRGERELRAARESWSKFVNVVGAIVAGVPA